MRLLVALVVALLVAPHAVRAQPRRDPDAAYREGRAHVAAGDRHYDAGAYRAAAEEYRAAYDLFPHPDLLFNIAQSYRLAGDATAAVEYYERFLKAVATGAAADKAREHLRDLDRATTSTSTGTSTSTSTGTSTSTSTGTSTRPETGIEKPELEQATGDRRQATGDRRPGERAGERAGERSGGRWGGQWMGPVVTAVGAAVVLTGIGLWVSADRSFDRLDESCAPSCEMSEWSEARTKERVGVGLGIGGAVVAAAGAVLWMTVSF